ncbi:MAG TPA: hypothetical protein VNV63_08265 [Nitrospiria bacterium]|jgi:hypothetical protein|nr:hypothetical protein [Nitrospiria bacterium]
MKSQLLDRLVEKVLEGESNGSVSEGPFEIGKAYLIRTVTYHQVGILKDIQGDFLIFKDASWVADSGRFSECLSKGVFNEVEYVGPMLINKTAIVDAFPWENKVPKETK